MILKKSRIGPVGVLSIIYKRIEIQKLTTQDNICALCGIGPERCETLIVYSSDNVYIKELNYHDLCYGLGLVVIKKSVTKNNITYIPWKIR